MTFNSFSALRTQVVIFLAGRLSEMVRVAEALFSGVWSPLKTAAATLAIAFLVTFPIYKGREIDLREYVVNQALTWQVAHPLSPIPEELKDITRYTGDQVGGASHVDKMEFRITVPILGWLSHTGAWTVVIWSPIAGFGLFSLLMVLASEALMDSVSGALFVLALGPTFLGGYLLSDLSCGDGVALFFMALSITTRIPVIAALALLAAAFCDERAVLAVPLLACVVAVRFGATGESGLCKKTMAALAAAVVTWAGIRWWMANVLRLTAGSSGLMTANILRYHLTTSFPATFLGVFKALWVLPVFCLLGLLVSDRVRPAATVAVAFLVATVPAFLVWDFERSVIYSFPVLLISLYSLRGDLFFTRKLLAAVLALNILLSPPGKTILRSLLWL